MHNHIKLNINDLKEFFPNVCTENLEQLSERIEWWCNQALRIIEIETTELNQYKELTNALKVIHNYKIPKVINNIDGWKKYEFTPPNMVEQVTKIQEILNTNDCYFPQSPPKNKIVSKALHAMFLQLYRDCEKITKLTWYISDGVGKKDDNGMEQDPPKGDFFNLITFLLSEMNIDRSDEAIRKDLMKTVKPKYDNHREFIKFLTNKYKGKTKISMSEYTKSAKLFQKN